jgi:hypothetical protein
MRRNKVALRTQEGTRAMTIRLVTGFLAIFATGLIAAPAATLARGGAFAGGRDMSFHRGFRAPTIRPVIAGSRRVAAPPRVHTKPFAHFRHRHARVPVVVWVGAPWYSGYDDPTYVVSDEQSPSDTSPTTASNTMPRLGCRVQTYNVSSESGGERPVKVVRC